MYQATDITFMRKKLGMAVYGSKKVSNKRVNFSEVTPYLRANAVDGAHYHDVIVELKKQNKIKQNKTKNKQTSKQTNYSSIILNTSFKAKLLISK